MKLWWPCVQFSASSFHFKRSNSWQITHVLKDENNSKVATMRGWSTGSEESLVEIPEHKTGKSALFSEAATERKCKS